MFEKEKVFLPNPFRNFLYHFHFLCWHFPRHKAFMKKVVKKKYIVLWLCVVLNVILQNIWKKGKILVSNLIQTTPCITFTFCVAAFQKPYGAFKQNMTLWNPKCFWTNYILAGTRPTWSADRTQDYTCKIFLYFSIFLITMIKIIFNDII